MPKSLFILHSQEEHAQALADFMPNGQVFSAKNIEGTNVRSFLNGLALEMQRTEEYLVNFTAQYDPRTTTNFINEWESAVGIPDSCFSNTGSIEQRRTQVLVKILAPGCNTREDFINIAALLGYEVTISYLPEVTFFPPYDVPINLIYGIPQSRFVWIVTGDNILLNVPPYDVPFTPGGQLNTVLQCFFEKLKPAISLILYRNS